MPKMLRGRTKKFGLVPGTLVYGGGDETPLENVRIRVMEFDENEWSEREVDSLAECFPFKESPIVTWIGIDGIHDATIMEDIGNCFDIHPLILEDIMDPHSRPKVEDLGTFLYISIETGLCAETQIHVQPESLNFLLGANVLISFEEHASSLFEIIRDRIRNKVGRIRHMGADYLAYGLIDIAVDGYFVVLETLGDRVEEVEDQIVPHPSPALLQSIQYIKRDVTFLRRSAWPVREVLGQVARGEFTQIQESTLLFFRDVYDHAVQAIDIIENFRDLLSGLLDIHLSSTSNRLNEVMKVLTIFSTIFMPLTFVVGLYGMNFDFMPELHSPLGYPIVIAVMATIVILMVAFFRHRKWI